jgi:hypothetical protein
VGYWWHSSLNLRGKKAPADTQFGSRRRAKATSGRLVVGMAGVWGQRAVLGGSGDGRDALLMEFNVYLETQSVQTKGRRTTQEGI